MPRGVEGVPKDPEDNLLPRGVPLASINSTTISNNNTLEGEGVSSTVSDADMLGGTVSNNTCSLACRSIRVGSYKVLPKERIIITESGVQIKVPAIENATEVVTLTFPMADVLCVKANLRKTLPVLFLYISPGACKRARESLSMNDKKSFFLDIRSVDETQKLVTILPEKMTDENMNLLKRLFGSTLMEIECKEANEILVRSSKRRKMAFARKNIGQDVRSNDGTKKRKLDQLLTNSKEKLRCDSGVTKPDNSKEKMRCDPGEVRDNIKKQLMGKIIEVDEEKDILKQAIESNAEKMEKEVKDLNGKLEIEKGNLDKRLDEEKKKLEEKHRQDEKEILLRYADEKAAIVEKYKDEESQQNLKDLTEASNQLGDDLKKFNLDLNDKKKLDKVRASLECPICMEVMVPPTRIWMCSGGHNLCETCKGRLEGNLCPTCRDQKVTNRNLGMEEIAASAFD